MGQGVDLTMHKINETNVILVMHVRFCDYLKFLYFKYNSK